MKDYALKTEVDHRRAEAVRVLGPAVRKAFSREDKQAHFIALYVQLELMVHWARTSRGVWPDLEVSAAVRGLEQTLVTEAEKLLDGVRGRAAELTANDEDSRLPTFYERCLSQMRELRGELAAILAVFMERDPMEDRVTGDDTSGKASEAKPNVANTSLFRRLFPRRSRKKQSSEAERPEIRDFALHELVGIVEPSQTSSGPEASLAAAIMCCLPLYAGLAWRQLHPMFAPDSSNEALAAVLATALLETARLLVVLWLPVVGAMSVRQFLVDRKRLVSRFQYGPGQFLRQRCGAIIVGLLAALLGLLGLALLWAFLIASSEAGSEDLLVRGTVPFLLFYPSMAFISLVFIIGVLATADARRRRSRWLVTPFALLTAACVAVVWREHLAFWYGGAACGGSSTAYFGRDAFSGACFSYYGTADLVILPVLAFLTARYFGNAEEYLPSEYRSMARLPRHSLRVSSSARPLVSIALLALILTGSCARAPVLFVAETPPPPPPVVYMGTRDAPSAGTTPMAPVAVKKPGDQITIGFREDAEPFSFKRYDAQSVGNAEYKGYVADLCYEIFAAFQIRSEKVTSIDRFQKLRSGEIDVLCDPVTLRYSDPEREGIYSPIIFATSVSYLRRKDRTPRSAVEVGYLDGSTAFDVARRACFSDLFSVVEDKKRADLEAQCAAGAAAAKLKSLMMADQAIATKEAEKEAGKGTGPTDEDRRARERRAGEAIDAVWIGAGLWWQKKNADSKAKTEGNAKIQVCTVPDPRAPVPYGPHLPRCRSKTILEYIGVTSIEYSENIDENRNLYKSNKYNNFLDILNEIKNCKDCSTIDSGIVEKMYNTFRAEGFDADCLLDGSSGVAPKSDFRFCPKASHEELIGWFCSKRSSGDSGLVYLGDRDLIIGKLRTWEKFHGDCRVEKRDGADDLTYEPYALLINQTQPGLVVAAQRGIYSFFSRRSHATRAFTEYFDGKMSTPLGYLFLLNATQRENAYTLPSDQPKYMLPEWPKLKDPPAN